MISPNPVAPLLAHLKEGVPLTTTEARQCVQEMKAYNYMMIRVVLFLIASAIPLELINEVSHHSFAHYAFYLHVMFLFGFVLWALASIWHIELFEELKLITEEEANGLKPSSLLAAIHQQDRTPFRMEVHWLKK